MQNFSYLCKAVGQKGEYSSINLDNALPCSGNICRRRILYNDTLLTRRVLTECRGQVNQDNKNNYLQISWHTNNKKQIQLHYRVSRNNEGIMALPGLHEILALAV